MDDPRVLADVAAMPERQRDRFREAARERKRRLDGVLESPESAQACSDFAAIARAAEDADLSGIPCVVGAVPARGHGQRVYLSRERIQAESCFRNWALNSDVTGAALP